VFLIRCLLAIAEFARFDKSLDVNPVHPPPEHWVHRLQNADVVPVDHQVSLLPVSAIIRAATQLAWESQESPTSH